MNGAPVGFSRDAAERANVENGEIGAGSRFDEQAERGESMGSDGRLGDKDLSVAEDKVRFRRSGQATGQGHVKTKLVEDIRRAPAIQVLDLAGRQATGET